MAENMILGGKPKSNDPMGMGVILLRFAQNTKLWVCRCRGPKMSIFWGVCLRCLVTHTEHERA